VVADGKRARRPELGATDLERGDVTVVEKHLRMDGTVRGEREGRQGSVPGDEDGRKEPGALGRAAGPQCVGGVTGAGDRGAERGADTKQRFRRHRNGPAQAILIVGVNTHRSGEGPERV
jgi:hypothetical protein